jgi:AcrR family transcriptional regulator
MLALLRPEALDGDAGGWQQRKSAQMRVMIIEATIDCLVEEGYAGLSLQRVAERAAISRGTMHHHYAVKTQLVGAVAEYTFYRRMQHFLDDVQATMARGERDAVAAGAQMHWRSVQTREYAAYLELAVASRTDQELNAVFLPFSRRFDKVWREEMVKAFPQWRDHLTELQLGNDFAQAVHMGLLLHKPVFRDGKRTRDVRALVLDVLRRLHAGETPVGENAA